MREQALCQTGGNRRRLQKRKAGKRLGRAPQAAAEAHDPKKCGQFAADLPEIGSNRATDSQVLGKDSGRRLKLFRLSGPSHVAWTIS
jgi:hypothetical protein